jgi:ribosomal protein S18 acetylase RimI-like enzyme
MSVRLATEDDLRRVALVLADAFSNDPPMRWVMNDSPGVVQRLRHYFEALVSRVHLQRGEVWLSDDPLGAAAWVKPGAWPLPASVQLSLGPVLLRTFGRHPRRAIEAARSVERNHPEAPHWYLDYIGVAGSARGRGTGSALMRPVLDRCDAERKPAFLNAGSEASRDLYARHGFEVTERFALPRGGPPLWRMWRAPP